MKHLKFSGLVPLLFVMGGVSSPTAFAQNDVNPDKRLMVRIPPIMPQKATRSGSCNLSFDITVEGRTDNIHVLQCTETLFARTAARSLSRWKYRPAHARKIGVETKISFILLGHDNKPLPALPMPRRAENPEIRAIIKSGTKMMKAKRKTDDNFCCVNYSVGADGDTFNRTWGTCPYRGDRRVAIKRLDKMTFKSAIDKDDPVASDGYQSIFWFYKDKAYTGISEDLAYCVAE